MFHRSSPILAAAVSPAFLAKGCVNIIELSSFKEQAGSRWSRLCESVYARLEALLRAKLGPNDLFLRIGEIAYLVTMPTTDPEDVSATCMKIAFDLHTSFLGQCSVGQIEVNTVIAGEDDALVLQKLPPEKIAILAERLGVTLSPQLSTDQAAHYSLAPQPTFTNGINTLWEPTEPPPPALTIEHQFVPIWSVRNAAVTTYVCEPKTIFAAGRQDSLPITQLTPKERIKVDIDAFKAGNLQLVKSHAAGNRFLLAAVISFELLGSPNGRMEFLATCRSLAYNYRSFLSYIICDVPPGVAQSRLASMVTILQPFGRGVSATISPEQRAYSSYLGIGLQSIGFNLREFSFQSPIAQHDVEQLAQFARRANLGTFLSGVQDKATLKYAQDANVAHLSGPAIAPASPEPPGMWRLTWADTLAKPEMEIWG